MTRKIEKLTTARVITAVRKAFKNHNYCSWATRQQITITVDEKISEKEWEITVFIDGKEQASGTVAIDYVGYNYLGEVYFTF